MRILSETEVEEVSGAFPWIGMAILAGASYKAGKEVGEEVGKLAVRAGWIPS